MGGKLGRLGSKVEAIQIPNRLERIIVRLFEADSIMNTQAFPSISDSCPNATSEWTPQPDGHPTSWNLALCLCKEHLQSDHCHLRSHSNTVLDKANHLDF